MNSTSNTSHALPPRGSGIELRVLSEGQIAYRAHFRVPRAGGWVKQSKQFPTLDEALTFKARIDRKPATARQRLTVAHFIAQRWQPNADLRQKNSTRCSEGSRIQNYILPHFGSTHLDEVTPAQWEQFKTTVTGAGGRALSVKTRQNIFGLFHSILQYAVEIGFLERNPLAKPLGSRHNVLRPHGRRKEKPTLTPEQFQAVLANLAEHWRPVLWMFAITGLRASEVAGLRWSDYDEANRCLLLRRGVVRRIVDSPKTEATRRKLGVPPVLGEALRKQRIYQAARLRMVGRKPAPTDYIFASVTGKPFDQDRIRRDVLYPAMMKAGIIPRDREFGWHIFRHSAASAHVESTGDILRTSKWLGHASLKTTAETYAHIQPAPQRDAELLQEHWMRSPGVPSDVPLIGQTAGK